MRRHTLILAVLGLLSVLAPAGGRSALGAGGHRGQTYHYNGSAGYWTAGGYACCNSGYATQTAQYVQRPAYSAPQPYYAPQASYGVPTNVVYAPAQAPWPQAVPQR